MKVLEAKERALGDLLHWSRALVSSAAAGLGSEGRRGWGHVPLAELRRGAQS